MTNILVEGGGTVLGNLFGAGFVDEVHIFIAPIIVGGEIAPTAIAGNGVAEMSDALNLTNVSWRIVGEDIYARGLVACSE